MPEESLFSPDAIVAVSALILFVVVFVGLICAWSSNHQDESGNPSTP